MDHYINLNVKAALTLAFVMAGTAKLLWTDMMVTTFESVTIGQWFRYVTGAIEVAAAALLWVAGLQMIGSRLLMITMIGATFAHLFVIGASAVPALVLGLLSAYIAFLHRVQLTAKRTTTSAAA